MLLLHGGLFDNYILSNEVNIHRTYTKYFRTYRHEQQCIKPEDAVSDQDLRLYCLPPIQQFVDMIIGIKWSNFMTSMERCPDIYIP